MAEILQVKAIKAKKMNLKRVREELLKAAKDEAKTNEKLLGEPIATWTGDKPKPESLVEVGRDDVTVLTGMNGSEKALNKFKWLDEGTRVRYATMSQDWKSKTKPGVLKSGRGRGRVLFVNKRRPRPGIKARGWTELIMKRRRRPFTDAMIKAKNKGLDKLYG